ncbi:rhodanese-like domain-containing protein [Bremerella cremea]|uniref:Rhodanese-like domain-containing protein n=2 Tax=Bremerella cremea TaxID=1031537 RepID=A0A368KJP2_9BACT|nr:rhodanese-like domain-containing protein [Bremerella cremea]
MVGNSLIAADPGNPIIDYQQFIRQVDEVGKLREKRRISEEQFIEMIKDPETVLLDARSEAMYKLLHVRGAVNLSLPDFTAETLAKIIPRKETRVVIYCNNNFKNEPVAFAPKASAASLNIHSFNALHSYGYTNVYELKPLLDRHSTKIPFAGTSVQAKGNAP